MNVNLHIDSIVLDGIEMGPRQTHLLRQAVSRELTDLFTHQQPCNSFSHAAIQYAGIKLDCNSNAVKVAPQLANAIYANTLSYDIGLPASHGGRQ